MRVLVVAVVDAGCATTRGDDHPAADTGRADYFAVSSGGQGPDSDVSVVLHVLEGRLYELEIFAGEGVAVDAASVTALTRPDVG